MTPPLFRGAANRVRGVLKLSNVRPLFKANKTAALGRRFTRPAPRPRANGLPITHYFRGTQTPVHPLIVLRKTRALLSKLLFPVFKLWTPIYRLAVGSTGALLVLKGATPPTGLALIWCITRGALLRSLVPKLKTKWAIWHAPFPLDIRPPAKCLKVNTGIPPYRTPSRPTRAVVPFVLARTILARRILLKT